jgi:hypothetical protein
MSTNNLAELDERVYKVAEEYKQRGYKVIIEPSPKQLPEFLTTFRPDLIAESSNESVIIELKSSSKARPEDYWSKLANTIQQHPGWRFELIVNDTEKRNRPETITPDKIKKFLEEGQRLAKEKRLTASLLLTWSATEAAMRLASKNHEVDLPDFRPATVISRLYTDGVLERDEYNFLLDCMRIRSAIAHGFSGEEVKSSFIKRLYQITLRLLEQ